MGKFSVQPKIGLLALQGAFAEHEKILNRLGVSVHRVRLPEDLANLDGLIMPGGESTVMGKLAERFGLIEPLRDFAHSGKPLWGTCAGLIFLAHDVGHDQILLELMDIVVERNAFGRQQDSFEQSIQAPLVNHALGESRDRAFPAVFIRAPLVKEIGPGVEILSQLDNEEIVAVRQNNLLGTAFHPELTGDSRWHRYFLQMVNEKEETR